MLDPTETTQTLRILHFRKSDLLLLLNELNDYICTILFLPQVQQNTTLMVYRFILWFLRTTDPTETTQFSGKSNSLEDMPWGLKLYTFRLLITVLSLTKYLPGYKKLKICLRISEFITVISLCLMLKIKNTKPITSYYSGKMSTAQWWADRSLWSKLNFAQKWILYDLKQNLQP